MPALQLKIEGASALVKTKAAFMRWLFLIVLKPTRLTSCDVPTHGCVFVWMFATPPFQVMQVTAELFWRAFNHGDLQAISERPAALAAGSAPYLLWFNDAVPWDAPIAILIQAGRIDRADCRPRA